MNRRNFFKFSVIGLSSPLFATTVQNTDDKNMMSIIDLDLCDGCAGREVPLCVSSCQEKNKDKFPKPTKQMMDYWPQTKHEDYSGKKDDISRLTPYNWTYVQNVEVGGKSMFIPRRCMHCDNPPCQKLCPFGVISKSDEGAVDIDKDFCFGGAKCRDACPWGIPQRQAGVGIYLKVAPKLAGGGVMFKCDMCKDLLAEGKKPTCETSCPKSAIKFGKRSQILELLKDEKREIYGLKENGGTSTVYVSSVKFEDIDEALAKKHENQPKMGRPHITRINNPLEKSQNLAAATVMAPIAGVLGATFAALKSVRTKNENQ
ncbi:dehydrogenase/reductase, iron-sulfur cluster subunit [Campylobacter iguaniorum]|uniref:4Fe-4S dicluster domain-containing protein n=1 Tax=Campylobacter iguaniorum TaxID=1244531 RepID=UPI0007C97597|nr:4Fe-4S dicluster domain-containing protein [Campylobacter iguaniorum]ANE35747.1 dehydrogenase/reductase, iron-sulfur cluster subunit [Campylobacter iguaniorum]